MAIAIVAITIFLHHFYSPEKLCETWVRSLAHVIQKEFQLSLAGTAGGSIRILTHAASTSVSIQETVSGVFVRLGRFAEDSFFTLVKNQVRNFHFRPPMLGSIAHS